MKGFVTRRVRPAAAEGSAAAPGRPMKVSQLQAVGPEKQKKARERPESVKVVTVTEPAERKQKKRKDVQEYKNARRAVQCALKYPEQMVEEKGGRLWCNACHKFVNFEEEVSVKEHLFGVRVKGADTVALFAEKSEEEN